MYHNTVTLEVAKKKILKLVVYELGRVATKIQRQVE